MIATRGKNEGYAKGNKEKYKGNQQWREGNWDSDQWFGPKGRNAHSTRTEWRNKNSKKMKRGLGTSRTSLNVPTPKL